MNTKNLLLYVAAGQVLLSAPLAFASEPVTAAVSFAKNEKVDRFVHSHSDHSSISADGRFIAFESSSKDLVDGDDNDARDIFVADTLNYTIERVSIHTSGQQANDHSYSPAISADGRYITFESDASNLDDNDLGYTRDIFVHDRVMGSTTRVSQEGLQSQGKRASSSPEISADGHYIIYDSEVADLVADDTNDVRDIFVYDRIAKTTTRVNVNSSGVPTTYRSETPSISANGRYITYSSSDNTLVSDDNNNYRDLFVYDRETGNASLISRTPAGEQVFGASDAPSISADGRYITYLSVAPNLVSEDTEFNNVEDVFVYDRVTGVTQRININDLGEESDAAPFQGAPPSISANGRYISYSSTAFNLVDDDTNGSRDAFVRDRQQGITFRASLGKSGTEITEGILRTSGKSISISAHGNHITFSSGDPDLVNSDPHWPDVEDNSTSDVFVRQGLNPLKPIDEYTGSFETSSWPEHWYSYGWSQDNSTSSDGSYALKANSTGDNETDVTEWHVNIANQSKLSFDMKVDSQQDADFFRFYIDDVLQAEYSGLINWTQYQYTLAEGEHKLRFEYAKDDSGQSGADTAWIDNIHLSNNVKEQRQTDFIERFYTNILGRPSDSGGLAFWLDNIQSSSATFVALAFFDSKEFHDLQLNNRDFINALYNTALGRDADQGGLDFWLGKIDNGLLRDFALYGFLQSDEFSRLAEQSGVTGYSENDHARFQVKDFVRRFYENVLERQPEQEGMDFWSERLFSGQSSASDIALAFFVSNEFINKNHDDSTFIDIAYQTILSRSPDEGGKTFWMEQLTSSLTRDELIQAFIVSHEFEVLASSYGIRVQ